MDFDSILLELQAGNVDLGIAASLRSGARRDL
jgi:hypothetical protein